MIRHPGFPAAAANGAGPPVSIEAMENVARTAHRVTVEPKSEFQRFRTHKHRFGTGVGVVWGIRTRGKAGPRGGRVYVHALLFDRKRFTPAQAKAWARSHGYPIRQFEAAQPRPEVARKKLRVGRRPAARVANAILPEDVMFHYISSANPAVPALRRARVKVAAKHRGVTGLPRGAWTSWPEHQLATHFLSLVPVYGPGMVNNWIKNIERWNKVQNPWLSHKAHNVRMIVEQSSRYRRYLGQPRSSFRTPNPSEAARMCGMALKNPALMVLTNPKRKRRPSGKSLSDEIRLAQKAYKSFHFKESKKHQKHKVPDGWPKVYVVLGDVDGFKVSGASGEVAKRYGRSKPILACTKDRKDVYIFSRNGRLGIPTGTAVRVDYSVPNHSGRLKWSKRWYHDHESKPQVTVAKNGAALRIHGPGLSVTPRGIIG